MVNPFQQRDDIRVEFCAGLLSGEGIEIGGGAYPQKLPPQATARYYDLRTDEQAEALFDTAVVAAKPVWQARTDFPNGADFLIAHNVLEHSPNPIGTLLEWNRLVRPGGVVVISLPHYRRCPDELRRVPPIRHLIDDYLGAADGLDFPSREHTVTFGLGWVKDFCEHRTVTTVLEVANAMLDGLHQDHHDVHWHAFNMSLSLEVVALASRFDGLEIHDMRCWSPETGQTIGDILISYTVGTCSGPSPEIQQLLALNRTRLAIVDRLSDEAATVASQIHAGEPVVAMLSRPFHKEGEFCFWARLPAEFHPCLRGGMKLSLKEGDVVLGPAEAPHQTIRSEGGGAYSFWNGGIYFSASDGTDCNTNGRAYFVTAEPSL